MCYRDSQNTGAQSYLATHCNLHLFSLGNDSNCWPPKRQYLSSKVSISHIGYMEGFVDPLALPLTACYLIRKQLFTCITTVLLFLQWTYLAGLAWQVHSVACGILHWIRPLKLFSVGSSAILKQDPPFCDNDIKQYPQAFQTSRMWETVEHLHFVPCSWLHFSVYFWLHSSLVLS